MDQLMWFSIWELSDTYLDTSMSLKDFYWPSKLVPIGESNFVNLEVVEKVFGPLRERRGKIGSSCLFEKPFNIGALGLRKANQSILQYD